ncbi:MAG: GNAT family N-acetyltransferase [Pontixanthobacter sp.]
MFFRSERLFLRPAWPEDANAIHRAIAHEDIVRNLATAPWPYALKDARAFVALERSAKHPSFIVTLPGQGLVGSAGMGMDPETGRLQCGYWIARDWWGRGFATEATRAILQIAHALGHREMTASHFMDNPASGKVLRKAGFMPTGEIRQGYSLARGCSDPVACFVARLGSDDDDDREDMRRAA